MAKFTKEELKAIPVYITPNEENGSVLSIPTIDMTGEEFTQLRLTHNGGNSVGASDISVLVGNDRYGRSPVEMFNERETGKQKEINATQQTIYQMGHDFEPIGASVCCMRYGLTLYRPSGMLYCAAEPGITANIDYIGVTSDGKPVILEMKNINGADHKKEIRRRYSDGLPAENCYVSQVLQQMYVSGITTGYVVFCWAESPFGMSNYEVEELYIFAVELDAEKMTQGVEAARLFIEARATGNKELLTNLPGVTPKDFTLIYGEGEGELLADKTATAEWFDACDEFVRASRSEECAKAEREKAEKELRRLLGSNKKAYVHNAMMDVEISTKTRESKSWDLEKLQELAPDVYEEGLSFSITEAKLKKLENKDEVLSCLTVKSTPVAGVKIKVEER